MTKRFEKAYDALVRAYFNDELVAGNCYACAVGNIVADASGIKLTARHFLAITNPNDEDYNAWWAFLFVSHTLPGGTVQYKHYKTATDLKEYEERLEKLTGYTTDEMAMVEEAFEKNTIIKGHPSDCMTNILPNIDLLEDQYNGLCAVVDVLLSFEPEDNNPAPLKNKFREHPKLVK